MLTGGGIDWALSPLSRLLTVLYIIIRAPIMFLYLRTTGNLMAKALRFTLWHITCSMNFPKGLCQKKSNSSTFYSSSSNSLSSIGSKHVQEPVSGSSSRRLKWQTRGNSVAGNELMQLKPTGGVANVIDHKPGRPAVAVPILGCIGLLAVYLITGASFVAESQGLAYSDAFYMCFITLCTVGLGGEVIRRSSDLTIILVVIFIFVGVTLLSTILHIMYFDVYESLQRYKLLKKMRTSSKPLIYTKPENISK